MKRKFLLCAAGLTILLLAGCVQQESQMGYIGAETAKQTALEAASLTAEEVSSISTDMSTRNGLDYYQVCFEAGGQRYQYDVDALTGAVIDTQKTAAAGADQSNPPEPSGPQGTGATPSALPAGADQSGPPETPGPQGTDTTPSALPAGADQSGPPETSGPQGTGATPSAPPAVSRPPATAEPSSEPSAYIGEDEAKRIALTHAGLTAEQVTFIHCKLDFDDGQWVYDVEFYSANKEEYDYEIDAYTGDVISYDYDAEYYSGQPGGAGAITAEQARQLVLSRVPGASDADIREFETDYDDGALQYEGKLFYNGMKYEFEIDAYSGFVREWSAEPFSR